MVRMKIVTIAGILLTLILIVGIASASTVSIGNAHVETVGESASVNLTLDHTTEGLSGYNITIAVSDPDIATITGIVFPAWASVTDNTTLPAKTVYFSAADLNEVIQGDMTDIYLGSVVLQADSSGKTVISVMVNVMDDDQGNPIEPSTRSGNFTVGYAVNITATAGVGGAISPSGTVPVMIGDDATFGMIPDSCFTISDILVDGASIGPVATYTFTNVTGDHTIAVEFAPINFTISSMSGEGGTISPAGERDVPCGTNQTFDIAPESGYAILDVLVDGIPVGAVPHYTFTSVSSNHTISAEFAPVSPGNFIITATAGAHGTIEPSGPVDVVPGTDQSFVITPDPGYNISTVVVDDIAQGALASFTFTNVSSNHTISAFFSQGIQQDFSVTLAPGWNLFSTPIKLERHKNTVGEVFDNSSLEEIELIYGWDGYEWFIPGPTFELKPLYALYVKARAPVTITLSPSTEPSAPPVRELTHGFSLIGPAPAPQGDEFPVMPINEAFTTIEEVPGSLVGYVIVMSPALNQPGWAYPRGGVIRDIVPFKGYWVFMENSGTLGGFSTTPLR